MTKLKTISLILALWCFNTSFCPLEIEVHLGFNLMPTWNGALVTFAEVSVHKEQVIDFKSIPEREFILISLGKMKSAANPNMADFMALYDIPQCSVEYLDDFDRHQLRCNTVENLWKLRYRFPPGDPSAQASVESGSANGGWALGPNGANAPSAHQRQILAGYNMGTLADFVWGGNCFRLIKSTTEPSWLSNYRQ